MLPSPHQLIHQANRASSLYFVGFQSPISPKHRIISTCSKMKLLFLLLALFVSVVIARPLPDASVPAPVCVMPGWFCSPDIGLNCCDGTRCLVLLDNIGGVCVRGNATSVPDTQA
ncbi:hypothetical protein BDW42DRAFT_178020 [Aspergillus taichungensis]|uniref:Uncharacterized protein n=1 Tax=Aspergillus taichungensis TaxID=482145 RepID=A0A2J5HIG0_9EURO|nr:hypothetical protein BDW42DRAFT_178020 [Aspergillus taichungensis]